MSTEKLTDKRRSSRDSAISSLGFCLTFSTRGLVLGAIVFDLMLNGLGFKHICQNGRIHFTSKLLNCSI